MHYFYNTDMFTKHGLAAPETYDDVIVSCAKLEEDKDLEVPFTINLHAGWAWRVEFHNMLKAYGGDLLNEDSTPKFNSPEGVKAVQKILEVVEALDLPGWPDAQHRRCRNRSGDGHSGEREHLGQPRGEHGQP